MSPDNLLLEGDLVSWVSIIMDFTPEVDGKEEPTPGETPATTPDPNIH
jgi:hypothetical protein